MAATAPNWLPLLLSLIFSIVVDGLSTLPLLRRRVGASSGLFMSTTTLVSAGGAQTDSAYLRALEDRVNRLSSEESDCLMSFWTDKLKCFQITPQIATTRVSITTTCLSINTILANPRHWAGRARWDPVPPESTMAISSGDGRAPLISLQDACHALKTSAWNGDAFQVRLHLLNISFFSPHTSGAPYPSDDLLLTVSFFTSRTSHTYQTPLIVRTLCLLGAVDRNDPKVRLWPAWKCCL